jgi:hypothetical protein
MAEGFFGSIAVCLASFAAGKGIIWIFHKPGSATYGKFVPQIAEPCFLPLRRRANWLDYNYLI